MEDSGKSSRKKKVYGPFMDLGKAFDIQKRTSINFDYYVHRRLVNAVKWFQKGSSTCVTGSDGVRGVRTYEGIRQVVVVYCF